MGKEAELQNIRGEIAEADMILVGLGEEFDDIRSFRQDAGYREGKRLLEDSEKSYLLPAWQEFFREHERHGEAKKLLEKGLQNLAHVLGGKNYFVVSVSTNECVREIPWREGRLVTPCGGVSSKQCSAGCPCGIRPLEAQEREMLRRQMRDMEQSIHCGGEVKLPEGLDDCPECRGVQTLNNIYNRQYDENGYLADWQNYTKWLQGTLNHRVLILELGVGMQFPSVIRFPFEKAAYFNQKAKFYRVNENLYQLTEELAEKGTAIAKNAIDWLQNLC